MAWRIMIKKMISTNDCHLGRPFTSALSITLVERNSEGRQFVSSTIGGFMRRDLGIVFV